MGNNGYRNLEMRVSMSNTDTKPLDLCSDIFGGSVQLLNPYDPHNRGYRLCYNWRASGVSAEVFAKAILPFSIIKREQLEWYLELRTLVASHRYGRQKRTNAEHTERLRLVKKIGGAKNS